MEKISLTYSINKKHFLIEKTLSRKITCGLTNTVEAQKMYCKKIYVNFITFFVIKKGSPTGDGTIRANFRLEESSLCPKLLVTKNGFYLKF